MWLTLWCPSVTPELVTPLDSCTRSGQGFKAGPKLSDMQPHWQLYKLYQESAAAWPVWVAKWTHRKLPRPQEAIGVEDLAHGCQLGRLFIRTGAPERQVQVNQHHAGARAALSHHHDVARPHIVVQHAALVQRAEGVQGAGQQGAVGGVVAVDRGAADELRPQQESRAYGR